MEAHVFMKELNFHLYLVQVIFSPLNQKKILKLFVGPYTVTCFLFYPKILISGFLIVLKLFSDKRFSLSVGRAQTAELKRHFWYKIQKSLVKLNVYVGNLIIMFF